MENNKKKTKTAGWIIVIILIIGLWNIAQYLVDMHYSRIAPNQFDSDATYAVLKTSGTIHWVIRIIGWLLIILCIPTLRKIWVTEKMEETSK